MRAMIAVILFAVAYSAKCGEISVSKVATYTDADSQAVQAKMDVSSDGIVITFVRGYKVPNKPPKWIGDPTYFPLPKGKTTAVIAALDRALKWDVLAQKMKPRNFEKGIGFDSTPYDVDWTFKWNGALSYLMTSTGALDIAQVHAALDVLKQLPDADKELAANLAKSKAETDQFQ